MVGHVYFYPSVAADDLKKLLTEHQSRLAHVIRQTEAAIVFEAFNAANDLWAEGQAFGPELEVRWRAAPGGFEVTVLTEQADLGQKGAGWKQHPKYRVLDEESRVYLWGRHWSKLEGAAAMERVPEGWAQARIPNELRYPVTAREFAFIRTRNYQRNGVTQFTRLVELKSHD
ncbi:MAG TPA: hypothetical protein VJL59_18790 [Anaerolineales bacterium]|nr:hypothetical protein [Anaerolineales bacterium]